MQPLIYSSKNWRIRQIPSRQHALVCCYDHNEQVPQNHLEYLWQSKKDYSTRAARQPHIWRIPKMEVPENHPFLFGGVHYKPSNPWYLNVSGVHLQGCSRKGLPEQRGSKELWSGRTVRCTRGYQRLQNPMMWVLTSVSSTLGLFWKLLAITWLLKLDAYYSTITTSPWFSVNTCTSRI